MRVSIVMLLFIFSVSIFAQEQEKKVISPEIQIKTALLAAPKDQRAEAMVYGYDSRGEFVVLRKGSNNLVCLADDPEQEGIHVACYSQKLEPFMARGRELKAQAKDVQEIRDIRKKEVEAGILKMPEAPSMLIVLDGQEENYNPETGELENASIRYVIHTPYATAESTGLPDNPQTPGMPWLMDPGTHRAHIMITPAQN